MQFHVGRSSPPPPVITANGQVVPFVSSAKLLGVTIQSHLRWDQHVDNITAKANSKRYFLAVLRRAGVHTWDLLQFYTTFVRPTVEYAAPVWHAGITAKQRDQLEAIQRSSLRIIFPDLSYRQALLHTRLPTVHDRRVNLCRTFQLRRWRTQTWPTGSHAGAVTVTSTACATTTSAAPPYGKMTGERPSELYYQTVQ